MTSNSNVCDVCQHVCKSAHGVKLHKFRLHGQRLTPKPTRKYTKRADKLAPVKPNKVVIPVHINFCSSCGDRIPNAFTMRMK